LRIKLDNDAIKYISFFERITKASVVDCMSENDRITFVVREGCAGMVIGRNGLNVKKLQEKLKKQVEIIEFSKNPIKFLTNLFKPIKVKNTYISENASGKRILHAQVPKNRTLAKIKMKKARNLIKKYYNIDEVRFT